jgi:hypothetical protein
LLPQTRSLLTSGMSAQRWHICACSSLAAVTYILQVQIIPIKVVYSIQISCAQRWIIVARGGFSKHIWSNEDKDTKLQCTIWEIIPDMRDE